MEDFEDKDLELELTEKEVLKILEVIDNGEKKDERTQELIAKLKEFVYGDKKI
jgi:hypothetical protein